MSQVSLLSYVRANQDSLSNRFTFAYVSQISDIRQLNIQATARTFKHKLHLSQSRQWREVLNYALLDQSWETYWGRHNIWLLRPSWDRHTETNTLQRRPSPLRIRSRHLNSLWFSFWTHCDWFLTSSVPRNVAVERCSVPMHTYFICSTRVACRYRRLYVPK